MEEYNYDNYDYFDTFEVNDKENSYGGIETSKLDKIYQSIYEEALNCIENDVEQSKKNIVISFDEFKNKLIFLTENQNLEIKGYFKNNGSEKITHSLNAVFKLELADKSVEIKPKLLDISFETATEEEIELVDMSKEITEDMGYWEANEKIVHEQEKRLNFMAKFVADEKQGKQKISTRLVNDKVCGFNYKTNEIIIPNNLFPMDTMVENWMIKKALNFREIAHHNYSGDVTNWVEKINQEKYKKYTKINTAIKNREIDSKIIIKKQEEIKEKNKPLNTKLYKSILTMLENFRTEHLIMQKIPATKRLIGFLNNKIVENIKIEKQGWSWFKKINENKPVTDILEAIFLAIQDVAKVDLKLSPNLIDNLNKVMNLLKKSDWKNKSFLNCKKLSLEVYDIIVEEYPNQTPPPNLLNNLMGSRKKNMCVKNTIEHEKSEEGKKRSDNSGKLPEYKMDLNNNTVGGNDGCICNVKITNGINNSMRMGSIHDLPKLISYSNKIASMLRRHMNEKKINQLNKRTGKPNMKKIRQEYVNYGKILDVKIMKKIKKEENKHSVLVLTDFSGSMGTNTSPNSRSSKAKNAMACIGNVMQSLNVNYMLEGFVARNNYDEIAEVVLKNFKEKTIDFKRISESGIPQGSGWGCNRDGYSIRVATERLLQEPGKKIMFVISDGFPSHYGSSNCYEGDKARKDVENAILSAEQRGVKIIGIAITNESNNFFKNVYPNYFHFEDLKKLPEQLIDAYLKSVHGV